jgi:hypothetical protein
MKKYFFRNVYLEVYRELQQISRLNLSLKKKLSLKSLKSYRILKISS